MKKKILATVLAGAMAATCAASLAACGDSKVSMPKGDVVTADEWGEFFDNTLSLNNYTFEYSVASKATVNGTVKTAVDYSNPEKKKEQTVEGKSELSESGLYLYDEENKKAYSETTAASEASMKGDEDKSMSSDEEISKEYYELKEEGVYWRTRYNKSDYSAESPTGKESNKEEGYWRASTTAYFADNYVEVFADADLVSFYDTKEEGATLKNITRLYDKFTFADGVYTATLYQEVGIYEALDLGDIIECTVSVSFNKAEKCMIGYSVKTKGEGNLKEETNTYYNYNLDYTYEAEVVYSVTEIKTTDVSKKVNKDITKAVDKAKADLEA